MIKQKKIKLFHFPFLLLIFSQFWVNTFLLAETVILKSHEVLQGKVTYQDAKILKMKNESGTTIELQKNDILKVSYRDVKDETEIKKIIQEEEKKLPPDQRKKTSDLEKRNRYKILAKSAVLPGWGQWASGNKWTGAISIFVFLGSAGFAYSQYSTFKAAEANYQSQSTLIFVGSQSLQNTDVGTKLLIGVILGAQTFQPYAQAQANGNNALQFLGFVYAAQLIHSYFLGKAWELEDPNFPPPKKVGFGNWNFNVEPRSALSPNGLSRETYYETIFSFRF